MRVRQGAASVPAGGRARRRGLNLRIPAARVALLLGGRRREIGRLFGRTAAAFGCPVPVGRAGRVADLLAEYARFTRAQADAALDGGTDLQALDRRLFAEAFRLGAGYRMRLHVKTHGDAMSAARLIYGALGIDFTAGPGGEVAIRRCGFARAYTPRVCALISALDRGLLAGLTRGAELQFHQRLTEGAPACRASLRGGRT